MFTCFTISFTALVCTRPLPRLNIRWKKKRVKFNAEAADRRDSRRYNGISGSRAPRPSSFCLIPRFCIYADTYMTLLDAGPILGFFALFHRLLTVCFVTRNSLATLFVALFECNLQNNDAEQTREFNSLIGCQVRLFSSSCFVDGVSREFCSVKTFNWSCKLHGQKSHCIQTLNFSTSGPKIIPRTSKSLSLIGKSFVRIVSL